MRYKVNTKLAKGRVRKSPTTKSKTLTLLKKGTIVTVDKIEDGWCHLPAYGGYMKASIMKKIEDPKPVTSTLEAFHKLAMEYCYHTNTKEANYPSGKPTQAYYDGFRKAFSETERKKWSRKAHKVGANCGAFVGTVVRNSGYDKSYPHTASQAYSHLKNNPKFKRLEGKKENLVDGCIVIQRKKNNAWHTWMYCEGKVREASFGDFYPKTTGSLNTRMNKADKSILAIFVPVE